MGGLDIGADGIKIRSPLRSTKADLGLVMIVTMVLQIVLVDIDTDGLKMN